MPNMWTTDQEARLIGLNVTVHTVDGMQYIGKITAIDQSKITLETETGTYWIIVHSLAAMYLGKEKPATW